MEKGRLTRSLKVLGVSDASSADGSSMVADSSSVDGSGEEAGSLSAFSAFSTATGCFFLGASCAIFLRFALNIVTALCWESSKVESIHDATFFKKILVGFILSHVR